MILLGTLLVVLLITITIGITFLRHHTHEVTQARERLEQTWWDRRNRLPLFFELARRSGLTADQNLIHALTLRSELISKALVSFTDIDQKETHLSESIEHVATTVRKTQNLKSLTLLQAMVNELEMITRQLSNERSHYTAAFQKLATLYKKPIVGKCAKMLKGSHFEPLFQK